METLGPAKIRFYSGRQESFIGDGPNCWRRMTPEDAARLHTGFDHETREPHVGIYISSQNGRAKIGFDLWRLGLNLAPAALARLEARWRSDDAVLFSQTALRTIHRKVHFSKSFATVVTMPERVEWWRAELESLLVNPESYEQL